MRCFPRLSFTGYFVVGRLSNIRVIVQFTVVPAGSGKSFGSVKTLYSYSTPYQISSASGTIDIGVQLANVDYKIGDQIFVKAYIIANNGVAGEQVTESFTVGVRLVFSLMDKLDTAVIGMLGFGSNCCCSRSFDLQGAINALCAGSYRGRHARWFI